MASWSWKQHFGLPLVAFPVGSGGAGYHRGDHLKEPGGSLAQVVVRLNKDPPTWALVLF